MSTTEGRWITTTPFGSIELLVSEDGAFDLAGNVGQLEAVGGSVQVSGSDIHLPVPQGDAWWIPLPDAGGVLRFDRRLADVSRALDFDSGLHLEIPSDWVVGEAPGAVSAYPPAAHRPGLPPSSFLEIYESLAPLEEELLMASMVTMLKERTGSAVQAPVDKLTLSGRTVWRFRSVAQPPTGEQVPVQLWVSCEGDHILALAQACGDGDDAVSDEDIEGIVRSARFPAWGRDERLAGEWLRTERRPSGPLTEIVTRQLNLASDGTYSHARSSLLEVPEGSRPPMKQPRETKQRIGLWYSQADQLLLSAGLQGYRVRQLGLSGDRLLLDGVPWSRTAG